MEKQLQILIVDDSATLRYIVVKMIRELGYSTPLAVGSAEEALPVLSNQKIDLLLLDWNLPQMSGLDLLRHIRATSAMAGLNVVMVTTMHERKNILEALKVGLQGYLLKPINKDALSNKIKEIEGKLAV
jgi:two-component system, chemotaxis family, chemotaxis protein CheY